MQQDKNSDKKRFLLNSETIKLWADTNIDEKSCTILTEDVSYRLQEVIDV
jgi:hypothetical protein